MLCYQPNSKCEQIVRIPAAGRPKLIQEQVEKLYGTIESGCKLVRDRKRSLRMLLDAAELQSYLQCAFDHFAMTLDVAFDFVQASFINNPIPFDFGGNILRMAISIMERQTPKYGRPDPRAIFQELSALVASCIMLDSVRHEIRGEFENTRLTSHAYTSQGTLKGYSLNTSIISTLPSKTSAIGTGHVSLLHSVPSIHCYYNTWMASQPIET